MKISKTITVNGIVINNECPECDGDGYFLEDKERNETFIKVDLCYFCGGKGIIAKTMIDEVSYDSHGNEVIIYKDGQQRYIKKGDEQYGKR